jgi:mannose/fructose-specific phosphotransferase system component IIA
MSSEEAVRGILISHGGMADGIVDAVRRITGAGDEALQPVSNHGLAPDDLAAQLRQLVGSGPTIIFTDLQSGSCGFAARRLAREFPQLVVISGVNLPLLLEFVMHRDMEVAELVPRLLSRGRAAIGCAPETLAHNADRSVPG